jgi:hypothetical protein
VKPIAPSKILEAVTFQLDGVSLTPR